MTKAKPSMLFCCLLAAATAAAAPPNVLFITIDDIRPDLNFGYNASQMYTPHIDSLARESLVLTAHHVQVTVCGPTRASLLVGRRPDTLRTVAHTTFPTYWRQRAPGNFSSVPQHFREHGYHTLSIGKVFDLRTSSSSATDRALICDGPFSWSEPTAYCDSANLSHAVAQSGDASHALLDDAQEADMTDVKVAALAASRLSATSADAAAPALPTPWFLAVGFLRPHLPFIVPSRHLDRYPAQPALPPNRFAPPDAMPSAASECSGTYSADPATHGCVPHEHSFELWQQYSFNGTAPGRGWDGWHGATNTSLPDVKAHELVRYYYAAVSHTDEMVGRVLSALRARPDADSTIVVLAGDHGWHLGQQSMWAKCTLFEASTRAPLLVRLPGLTTAGAGGAVVVADSLTEHVDVFPTLCEAAGLPPPPLCPPNSSAVRSCTEGASLVPLARRQQQQRGSGSRPAAAAAHVKRVKRAAFSQWPHPFASQPLVMGYSIRTDDGWRYTEWVPMSYAADGGAHLPDWTRRCARELYALPVGAAANGTSAQELANVAEDAALAGTVALLRARLVAGWRYAQGAGPWPELPVPPPAKDMGGKCAFGVWVPPPTPPPPTPPTPPTPAPQWVPLGNGDYDDPRSVLVVGTSNRQPSLAACEASCAKLAACAVGLFVNGTVRHGECWLAATKAAAPVVNFCGAKPGQECAAFAKMAGPLTA